MTPAVRLRGPGVDSADGSQPICPAARRSRLSSPPICCAAWSWPRSSASPQTSTRPGTLPAAADLASASAPPGSDRSAGRPRIGATARSSSRSSAVCRRCRPSSRVTPSASSASPAYQPVCTASTSSAFACFWSDAAISSLASSSRRCAAPGSPRRNATVACTCSAWAASAASSGAATALVRLMLWAARPAARSRSPDPAAVSAARVSRLALASRSVLSSAARWYQARAPASPPRSRTWPAGAFERGGDLLVGADGRGRPLPGAPVGLAGGVQGRGQRLVRRAPQLQRCRVVDGRPDQRVAEGQRAAVHLDQADRAGRVEVRERGAERGRRPQDRAEVARALGRRDQQRRPGGLGEAGEPALEGAAEAVGQRKRAFRRGNGRARGEVPAGRAGFPPPRPAPGSGG